ncbi:MAG: hypothetical protein IJY50_09735 [Clostridia bacterium]|nr:hypothetical protein [Clostridia bacterium]
MRTFFVFVLCAALLVSALFAKIGSMPIVSTYHINAAQYLNRMAVLFETFPTLDDVEYHKEGFVPRYVELMPNFPSWQEVSVEKWSEVPKAITDFMNNCITYMRHFFDNLGGVFPKLWSNIQTAVEWLTLPIRNAWGTMTSYLDRVFNSKDWFNAFKYCLLPLDWQRMVEDGEVRMDGINIGVAADTVDFDKFYGSEWRGRR